MRMNKILGILLCCLVWLVIIISGCGSGTTNTGIGQHDTAAEGSAKSTGYSVTDITGTKVTFSAKPQKILTFAMYTDQIVLGLVTSDHLAGINVLLEDPVLSNVVLIAKKVKRKIGNPSAEEVLAMKPDLVLVSEWTQPEKVQSMRRRCKGHGKRLSRWQKPSGNPKKESSW